MHEPSAREPSGQRVGGRDGDGDRHGQRQPRVPEHAVDAEAVARVGAQHATHERLGAPETPRHSCPSKRTADSQMRFAIASALSSVASLPLLANGSLPAAHRTEHSMSDTQRVTGHPVQYTEVQATATQRPPSTARQRTRLQSINNPASTIGSRFSLHRTVSHRDPRGEVRHSN